MPDKLNAVISSTVRDLPDYRTEAMDACLRMDVFPKIMEQLPALDADAIAASLALVDQAGIYIGIFAHRYGYVPRENNPKQISITEMEYNRAVERKIPRLIFLMDENHPVKPADVDKGPSAEKLEAFKRRIETERVRNTFTNKEDLRGKLIHALGELRKEKETGEKIIPDFHPPNIIPKPPEPYIPHPYSLLQIKDVIGRQTELNLLTDWVTTNEEVPAETRIFTLVAIGGMGKSALTWKWFNDIAPNKLPHLAGRMWWSFYESDAHWENFIIRALTYASGQSEKIVREMTSPDREDQLLRIVDQQPFLLVLDGLERILLAYARMDAAQMLDDDLDEKTANFSSSADVPVTSFGFPPNKSKPLNLPTAIPAESRKETTDSVTVKHQLRLATDHRAGHFLNRLRLIKSSRILITTRLYPANLQTRSNIPLPNCFLHPLTGLSDDDALNLWCESGVSGSRDQLLTLFHSFDNYPLLISALAGEVTEYRPAPRNFDQWRMAHPDFNPEIRLHLQDLDRKSHVLAYALVSLKPEERKVLRAISAFQMPTTWETLRALLVITNPNPPKYSDGTTRFVRKNQDEEMLSLCSMSIKACESEGELDRILTALEDRGLLGWDRKANRYDVHPVVRAVVWNALDNDSRQLFYREQKTYFDGLPKRQATSVRTISDLTPSIELFSALVGLERYDEAFHIFCTHLSAAMNYRLGAYQRSAELLSRLFSGNDHERPRLKDPQSQSRAVNALARSYKLTGRPGEAIRMYMYAAKIDASEHLDLRQANRLRNAASAHCSTGDLHEAHRKSLQVYRMVQNCHDEWEKGSILSVLGTLEIIRGHNEFAWTHLTRSLSISNAYDDAQVQSVLLAYLAELDICINRFERAKDRALRAWKLASVYSVERDFVRAARLTGLAALGLEEFSLADERLQHALARARFINLVEEELPSRAALAELRRRKQEFAAARDLLEQIWDPAERGPYPLFHADALNVLAQIERDQNNTQAAIAAADKAYKLAWCDGPPYAYHYGLTNARKHLHELGAPEPQLPPFDESKFEAMPDVELNPKDEFWVDPDKLDSVK